MHNKTTYSVPEEEPYMAKETAATIATCTLTNPQTIILTVPEGHDAERLRSKVAAYYATLLTNEENIEQQFLYHYNAWIEETGPTSSSTIIRQNRHFKAIVKMGKKVVPYIVEQLKQECSHLTWALSEICGPLNASSNLTNSELCQLWIERLND